MYLLLRNIHFSIKQRRRWYHEYKENHKDTCILFIITIVSGCLLGFVYNSTKDKIAAKQEETKLLAYKQVMSEADDFKADYSKLIQQSSKLLTKDYGKMVLKLLML